MAERSPGDGRTRWAGPTHIWLREAVERRPQVQGQGRKCRKSMGVQSTPVWMHPAIGCRTRLLRTQEAELEGSGEGQGPQTGPRTHTVLGKH